ncbi:unnamed protein product [Mytilus coruscus]|uniref:Uncharacterized protein n=1 Tax=Mytilus coruscus TaxID=42192 RepID=A0A6J8A6Z2_MYTCO|nr:unnamed protein product [Mytilus coruscus]
MCFVEHKNELYLVYIDADNKKIVRQNIIPEKDRKEGLLKKQPNRLSKINDEAVAVIYKKGLEVLIFNVKEMKEEKTLKISEQNILESHNGIQGILALSENNFILSDKMHLCVLQVNENEPIVKKLLLENKVEFDTARRLTHAFTSDGKKDIIFIADENDKRITSITIPPHNEEKESIAGHLIMQQIDHNRGLQNVRAIVATQSRIYAATSAGISVFSHNKGCFKNWESRSSFGQNSEGYKMLLEYKEHVEHTRNEDFTHTYDTSKVQIHDTCYTEEVSHATDLLQLFLKGDVTLTDINQSNAMKIIRDKIEQFRQSRSKHRTANLWFQYPPRFYKGRENNWHFHLESLKAMLPYFTASGHNLYVKSAWIYLNQMECLKEQNAEVAALFEGGYHVIRRTDQYWAGFSSDLAIEQALMRSIKTTGGLTRGRGMSESQRALWILSMPDCAEVNNAMMSFTGTKFYSSDQHKEDGLSRQKRVTKDTMIFASFLERNPMVEEEGMRNIETGVSATSDVNADRAKDIGLSILKSMEGKCVSEFTFKRKYQAITLQDKPICRFIVAADSIYEDKSEIFGYELSSQPSSMFDSSGFMRSASKSTLADAIWNLGDCSTEYTDIVYSYVVDGGSLVHKIPWKSGLTFGEICKRYIDSILCRNTQKTTG